MAINNLDNMGDVTIGTYAYEWWQSLPAATRHKAWWGVALFSTIWLAGASQAGAVVAGIGRLEGIARLLVSLCFGGFTFLWQLLVASGHIQETADEPNLLWLLLALILPGLLGLIGYLLSQPPNPRLGIQKLLEKTAAQQGRRQVEEMAASLTLERGIPLVQLPPSTKRDQPQLLGLAYERLEGHLLVTAPTRAGKGLHLTETLRYYPGPAFIIDPKGEQYERTAALRRQLGPIYRIPGHRCHLSGYYQHLIDRDAAIELHYHLVQPWRGRESIFAEKSLSLFLAAGAYGRHHGLNPVRLLLDIAESNPETALTALRTVEAARRHVDVFTNGALPTAYQNDRFVTSALGNFTTRLAAYQKHIDTIAPDLSERSHILPPNWAAANGTVYLTYSPDELRAVGGVVAAIVAAMLRYEMGAGRSRNRGKLLLAIDELPAVGLRNLTDYLATCGGYGISLLLYAQSVSQLQEIYGPAGLRAILSNCDHQLWYPAAELETARLMSELYGTMLKASPVQSATQGTRQRPGKEGQMETLSSYNQGASWSWREGAALSANEMMALPRGQVLVATRGESQRHVFLGERLNPIPLLDQLPGPEGLAVPPAPTQARTYTDWAALSQAADAASPTPAAEAEVGAEAAAPTPVIHRALYVPDEFEEDE